jgi:hypothetical protein
MSIAEVTSSITKHNYLIFDVDDIPHIIHQRKTSGDHCVDFFYIVLDHLDPDDKLFMYRLYHNACHDTRDNRHVEDSATTSRPRDHAVIANDNPTTYTLQPENVFSVASFVEIDNDQKPP